MTTIAISRSDQERIRTLLTEAVTVLCRNGLTYTSHVVVDGLLGITVDDSDVFLVKLCEKVRRDDSSPDFSHVSELLGAAQNNFGLSLAADGSSPLPTLGTAYGKDLNDNHTPHPINITPLADEQPPSTRRGSKRRTSSGHQSDSAKRTHITPQSAATTSAVGRIGEDETGNLVIKSEPMSDEEDGPPRYMGKALGVMTTVPADPDYNADDDSMTENESSQSEQTENQDGVLQALRAALIHKLSNNNNNNTTTTTTTTSATTPKTQQATTKDSPSPTPTPSSSSSGSAKRRKVPAPKTEAETSEVTLKCLMCTYETNRRYNFIRHMRGHSKSYAIYACDLCGERFHSEDELGAHGLEAHKGHHLTCDQCGMTFMSERGKNIHAKTHKMMPIPEKKSVECETQCGPNDLEESMNMVGGAGVKVMTGSSTGMSMDEDEGGAAGTPRYRTLREQLSSPLVIRFPVMKKPSAGDQKDDASSQSGTDMEQDDDQPADLRITSKTTSTSCSTSTSPPPQIVNEKKTASTPPDATPINLSVNVPTNLSTKGTPKAVAASKVAVTTATVQKIVSPAAIARAGTAATTPRQITVAPAIHATPTNLSIAAKSVTSSTSAVLPTSALSAALAAAAKAKANAATSSSRSSPVTTGPVNLSPKPASDSDQKIKSRKQSSAQIVRLVTVKKEPGEQQ